MASKSRKSSVALVASSLVQCLSLAGIVSAPLPALAQARPNIAETMRPVEGRKNYAQDLVDRMLARHPELIEVDIHATPPGSAQTVIVAAKTKARIGKTTDADDLLVLKSGEPRIEINHKGDNNVEVAVALRDVTKRDIGVIELTFPYPAGTDQEALVKKAEAIRDELSRRISYGAEDLVTPAQYDLGAPVDTLAQSLVDDTFAKQPGVLALVLHIRDARGGYPVIASTIGRIGKQADESDLRVIRSGESSVSPNADGRRLEVKLPMRDTAGNTVGAVAVVFPRGITGDATLVHQAETIRDELSRRVASAAALLGPYPMSQPGRDAQTEYDKQELGNTQSLPMTKAVVSGEALEQTSQEGYAEALRNVAAVSPANSKGSSNDSLIIRGIKINLFSNFRINGGLPVAGVQTQPNEDKERVEALKGANALMFGIASPAGIINLVTKRAGPIDVTSVAAAGNSFGQAGTSFDVGRRFGADREFGVRVNGSYAHVENGVVGGTTKFIGAGLDYRVNDRLSIQGDYEWYSRSVLQQAGISLLAAVNGVVPITPIPDMTKFLSGPWATLKPHTENKQVRADFVINDSWKLLAEIGRSDSDRTNYAVRIGSYNIVTGAGGIATVNYADQVYQNNFGRAEALGQFSTWFLSHSLTVGVSQAERIANTQLQNNTTLAQRQNIFDPIELPAPVFTKAPTSMVQKSKDTAAYAYDTIGIGPSFKLLAGYRNTKDVESSTTGTGSGRTTNVSSPAYGALYDIIPSVTVFASYMEGLEAGGIAPATAVNVNEILPSAVSKQKEIGIRDSHIKGLSLSGSYFEITRANAVTDPVTKIYANSGEIEYKGFEATAAWAFLPRWSVNIGGQILKARQVTSDPTFNGFWPENTPKRVGNVSLSYRPVWVPGLTLNAGVSGISARFVNNQEQATIPGYALYSLGAGYVTRIQGKRVALQFGVDNVANRHYWNSVQTGTYGSGTDRSYKLNVRVDL